jgi:hypothetical protein
MYNDDEMMAQLFMQEEANATFSTFANTCSPLARLGVAVRGWEGAEQGPASSRQHTVA